MGGVVILALGSWPKQGLAKVQAKSEARECGKVWKNEPHTPKWAPTWGVGILMESQIFKKQL